MFYAFFWVIPGRLFNFHKQVGTCLRRWNRLSVPKSRHIKFIARGNTQKKVYNKKTSFTFHYISDCCTLVMKSEEADFHLLYIAVALNVVVYFHSYVLYFRYILGLLSGITGYIGVLTYGQDDETLHFRL